eukprot:2025290-Pyramimonas_sp.AAC.1
MQNSGGIEASRLARRISAHAWGFPPDFRATVNGWFVFSTLETKHLARVLGGMSVVTAATLKRFSRLKLVCQDEKAMKAAFGVIGSAGLKPCLLCRN